MNLNTRQKRPDSLKVITPILIHLVIAHSPDYLERAALQRKLEDEREAKDRALAALNVQQRSPPVTPRGHMSSGSRENLERLHHANDAKLVQLENDHKRAIAQLTYALLENFKSWR